jgi:hypothetical protein
MIAEEASAEWVKDHGPGAISVARRVAAQMRVRHRYWDPDRGERRACGLKVGGDSGTRRMPYQWRRAATSLRFGVRR